MITSYEGPIIHRTEVEEAAQMDTSYVLRIPDSGGALIDGKPIGDAIRANPNNPGAWGRYYPIEGAPEWRQGAASMANDPRDVKLYNSRISFCRRQGANKALTELAPMRAILFATRDIKARPPPAAHARPVARSHIAPHLAARPADRMSRAR